MDRKKISSEMLVGILVIIGIILLLYMSFRIGKFGVFHQQGYEITATFNNTNGLDPRSPVQIAGVEVGRVKNIKLDGYKALVTLLIRERVKIPVDSKVTIKTQGMLGDKYIEIVPGAQQTYLSSGDSIKDAVVSPDFGEIFAQVNTAAKNFGDTMGEFKGIIGEQEKVNIKKSIENLQAVSGDFKELVATNKNSVTRIVNNMETISSDIEQGKGTLGKLAKDETLYNETKDAVANIKEFTDDIKQGKGTLGKLAKDESLYNETEKTMKKVQKAAEGIQELTPITILGTVFGTFF
jgi:phospholipid/cholesterol/gamma-HCH transport system substrate-binding protein